ncbi:MAG: glycosyltransferase family 39 protein [Anaerolineae bacterium]|nr:glycosyltransferase family 39 protein [Anaerolineae bacterium]
MNVTFSLLYRYGGRVAVGLAVLGALLLPLNLLTSQPFHHDEALYATWVVTLATGDDPWLSATPIDKPPLFLLLVAGAFRLLGITETTARLPSLLATAAIILLIYQLGCKLYNEATGVLAAWLTVLSPFTILFAPTALTDPTLVALVLAGCLAAAHGRAGWAAISAALAIATKQQGIFFVPLIAGCLFATKWQSDRITGNNVAGTGQRPDQAPTSYVQLAASFLLFLCLTLLPFIAWDLSRSQPSAFFQQSLNNYGGLAFDLSGFNERWYGFVELLQYGTGSLTLNIIFLTGLPLLIIYNFYDTYTTRKTIRLTSAHRSHLPFDLLLVLFGIAFLWLHTLFSFQIWDRYLLGLIPLLALLLARILLLPWTWVKNYVLTTPSPRRRWGQLIFGVGIAILLAASLARPVQDAVLGRYPLGSHSQAVTGIEQIVAYLQGHVGADTTLYHHWLGTYWRFYLRGYPYDLQFWNTPAQLSAKAKPGHLIAFPAWRSDTEARLALFEAGLGLRELARAYKPDGSPAVILYRLEPLP